MDKERLAVLKSAIEAQIREIEKIYNKVEERKRKRGVTGVESIEYQLHNKNYPSTNLIGFPGTIPPGIFFRSDRSFSHH